MSATAPDTPQVLLEHHLKALRLPTILREYDKLARTQSRRRTSRLTFCGSLNLSYWIATAARPSAASASLGSPS